MAEPLTYDQMAVRLILRGDEAGLKKLQAAAHRAVQIACGLECPGCGGKNVEDNGLSGNHYEFTILCHDCDDQFSPNAG